MDDMDGMDSLCENIRGGGAHPLVCLGKHGGDAMRYLSEGHGRTRLCASLKNFFVFFPVSLPNG